MSKYEVKNVSTATIVLLSSDLRVRRELQPGRAVVVNEELYEDLSFNPGFSNLIQGHYITAHNLDEKETAETKNTAAVYDVAKIKEMFAKEDITSFAKFIATAADGEKDTVVKLAIDMGITNNGFTALIKKYCNVDVIKAIAMKHEIEEK